MRYCSQCKNSEYVNYHGGKALVCHRAKELGIPKHMETNSLMAMTCGEFNPERKEDAPKKDRLAWLRVCEQCGIDTTGLEY